MRLTCTDSLSPPHPYSSDSLIYAPSDSFSCTQIYPDSCISTQTQSVQPRSTQSHLDLLCLTQILVISHSFADPHPICIRFAQIHKISLSRIQIDSISFQILSAPLGLSQMRKDLCRFNQFSQGLRQIRTVSLIFLVSAQNYNIVLF